MEIIITKNEKYLENLDNVELLANGNCKGICGNQCY